MDPDSSLENEPEINSELDFKARFGRRLFRRARINKPAFDGDGDGFMTNPLTGEDNVPAPRVKPRPTRRVVLAQPWSSRTVDSDDEDPLEELNRRLGISKPSGRDQWTAIGKKPAGEEREDMGKYSPVEVARKRVGINNFSSNQFLRLMDDLVDYAKANAADLEERDNKRVWKLLFVMQKINQLEGIKRSGDGISVNISEDELKRLYKGLETMTEGAWSDDEDAIDLFKKIKALYRKSWDSIAEAKMLITDYEVKALGRTLGRRARSAVRRVFNRIDGDGDGFTTNPTTGRDDLPVANVPDVAKPKKPLTLTDVNLMALRARGRNLQAARRDALKKSNLRAAINSVLQNQPGYIPSGPSRTHEEAYDIISAAIGASRVKDRDWAVFEKRINRIEEALTKKYGQLETLDDFERAFTKLFDDIYKAYGTSVKFNKRSFERDFTPEDKGFLKGVLHMLDNFSERYKDVGRIKIKKAPPPPEAPNASAAAAMDRPWKQSSNPATPLRVFASGRLTFMQVDRKPFEYNPAVPAGSIGFQDGISRQAYKAFFLSKAGPNVDKGALLARASEISGMVIGVHEGTHGLHYISGTKDLFPNGVDAETLNKMVEEVLTENPGLAFERFGILIADKFISRDYAEIRGSMQFYPGDDYFEDVLNDPSSSPVDKMIAQSALDKAAAYQQLIDSYENMLQNTQDSEVQEVLSAFQSFQDWGHPGKVQEMMMKLIFENPSGLGKLGNHTYAMLENITFEENRDEFVGSAFEKTMALEILLGRKLWDDMSDQEISDLRKIWKYVSSYAKDRNSVYHGTHNIVSVEGMAEAMALRIFGFDLPKDKVSEESMQALNKWLYWVSGEIEKMKKLNMATMVQGGVYQ